MTGLITQRRVHQMSNICRWNGGVSRFFSILEHEVIGTSILRHEGASVEVQQLFLLHDTEESEFTDMISPHKAKYMNEQYHTDVAAWNKQLYDGHGMSITRDLQMGCDSMDMRMRASECQALTPIPAGNEVYPYDEELHGDAYRMIVMKTFGDQRKAINGFWEHYHRLFS